MNRKRSILIILLLVSSALPLLITIPTAEASELVVSVSHVYDDVWMTEAGNIFSNTFMVVMLDEEIGIHAFLRFQNLTISKSAKINYATLTVYVAESCETPDTGSSVTIYGIDEIDCTPFTSDGSLWSLSRAYTSASVNWNTMTWGGYRSVNVTDIVKEIINQYAWESGNDLGLQILGASDSGHASRSFENTYHPYHDQPAKLTIVYDVSADIPDGLPDNAVFEETYGEYDIWTVPGFLQEIIPYLFTEGTADPYEYNYDNTDGDGPFTIWTPPHGINLQHPGRHLAHSSNGTLFTAYGRLEEGKEHVFVSKSFDGGQTWIEGMELSTYSGMSSRDQGAPTIAIDGNDTIHVAFVGLAGSPYHTQSQVWYVNYTDSWGDIVRLNTYTGQVGYHSHMVSIASAPNGNIHVVFLNDYADANTYRVWYTNFTTFWTTPIRVSNYSGMTDWPQTHPVIEVDNNNMPHISWSGQADGFANSQIWYSNITVSTPLRISNATNMLSDPQSGPISITIDSNNSLHIIFKGRGTGPTLDQIYYLNRTASWFTPIIISTAPGMSDQAQFGSTIGLGLNDTLHALWFGKATELLDKNKVWYANRIMDWSAPICLQPTGQNQYPSTPFTTILGDLVGDTFFLVDNETLVQTWNGDNFTDIDDLKDWTDDYVDPEGGDPLDPDPGTQGWDTEGPWTRFKMRLYFLFIGLGCLFTPLWAMAYKKFDAVGYAWCFLIMILGVGLLWSITGI